MRPPGDEADESRQDAEQLNVAQNSPEDDQPSVGERLSRTSSFSEYEAVDNLFANDSEVERSVKDSAVNDVFAVANNQVADNAGSLQTEIRKDKEGLP